MNDRKPRFNIGDRVQLLTAYDPATDEFYPTDHGDEGIVYGLVWNGSDRWGWEETWLYFVRWDVHCQDHLPRPFWDPDPTPEQDLTVTRF